MSVCCGGGGQEEAPSVSTMGHLGQWVVGQDTELEVACQEMGCAVERKAEVGYSAGAD